MCILLLSLLMAQLLLEIHFNWNFFFKECKNNGICYAKRSEKGLSDKMS